MDEVRIIEIKQSIFEDNDKDADRLRSSLRDKGVFLLNLMSSPGSGKTTTLTKLIPLIKEKYRVEAKKANFTYFVSLKKARDAFRLVQFACKSSVYAEYEPYFVKWAKSVRI